MKLPRTNANCRKGQDIQTKCRAADKVMTGKDAVQDRLHKSVSL